MRCAATRIRAARCFARVARRGFFVLAVVGFAGSSQRDTTVTVSAATRHTYRIRCFACHGEAGKGDGPSAAAMFPPPRDFSERRWVRSLKDDDIKRAIVSGMGQNQSMPANPDLAGTPELDGLVAYIRSFAALSETSKRR